MMKHLLSLAVLAGMTSSLLAQAPRVFPEGELPDDSRLKPLKDLNGFFPFEVPETLEAWEARAEQLRRRVLVANGLWPMPPKTPLNAVIHGKVKRPGFTAEKVYFESSPGFFVTGMLFRPESAPQGQKLPAVLCPHGHGGRLQDSGVEGVKKYIVTGGERFLESGRMPKVARCAALARQGYVAFLYDMIGYADNRQLSFELGHRFAKQRPEFEGSDSWGLYSAQAEMRLQSIFGLQTWNSIRALDFLESLPDTDPKRLAVTGGSGGGTQTIMLCAIDPRPAVAFPNGMVSSSMQGGCTCENASLLRIGTGNVELTALFAPKPQGMTSANDWTKEMLVPGKGFFELQKLYSMYGKKNDVMCQDLTHFPHNYNYVTRALMYSWFNRHLKLGLNEPIVEEDFKLLTAEEHAVWNDDHPEPPGGGDFERKLTSWIADRDQQMLAGLSLDKRRETIRSAWQTIIGRGIPDSKHVRMDNGRLRLTLPPIGSTLGPKVNVDTSEVIPVVTLKPSGKSTSVVIWAHEDGKNGLFDDRGNHSLAVQQLLDRGATVLAADLFMQGEFLKDGAPVKQTGTVANKREFAGYTHGYNHSVFARRTHDVLTLLAYAHSLGNKPVHLIGTGAVGPVAAAARAVAGKEISRSLIVDADFRFENITSYRDPNFIPGAVKYGDLPGLLDLSPADSTRIGALTAETISWLTE